MNKFMWFMLGCTMAFPAYQWGYGKGLDWVAKLKCTDPREVTGTGPAGSARSVPHGESSSPSSIKEVQP